MDVPTSFKIISDEQQHELIPFCFCLDLILIFIISAFATSAAAGVSANSNLLDISLEQLGQINITTASKVSEPLRRTAATVKVITGDDLRRMGTCTTHDALAQIPSINAVVVHNLTNQDYAIVPPAGTIPSDFTVPGRSLLIGIGYDI